MYVDDKVFVFDYQERSDPTALAPGETRNLERGHIDPDELQFFDSLVFVTHAPQDHFDPVFLE